MRKTREVGSLRQHRLLLDVGDDDATSWSTFVILGGQLHRLAVLPSVFVDLVLKDREALAPRPVIFDMLTNERVVLSNGRNAVLSDSRRK